MEAAAAGKKMNRRALASETLETETFTLFIYGGVNLRNHPFGCKWIRP